MKSLRKSWQLHVLLLPSVIVTLVFAYLPMGGLVIAFQRFIPALGLFGDQQWVGWGNFEFMLSMPNIFPVIRNTVFISVGKIVVMMVVPIFYALLLNEIRCIGFKRSIQTLIYFPYFLSWVILAGILLDILSVQHGIVNDALEFLGLGRHFFLGDPALFPWTMIVTEGWRIFGFGTVIYLAIIAGIDPTLYEAAAADGAGRLRQTWHITLPGMRMIIVLLMVLNLGVILRAGFDQIFNLYSPGVFSTGDILDPLVYRLGLIDRQFGLATAVGLFQSAVSFVLISASYLFAYKVFDYKIF